MLWGGYDHIEHMMFIFTPTDDYPLEQYQVRCFRNFLSDAVDLPYEVGQVVKVVNPLALVDVSQFQSVFNP